MICNQLRGNYNLSLLWLLQPDIEHYHNPYNVHFVDYKLGSSKGFTSWVNKNFKRDPTKQLRIFDMHMRWINFTAHVRPRSAPLLWGAVHTPCAASLQMKSWHLNCHSLLGPLAGICTADIHQRCSRPCCSAGFQLVLHQEKEVGAIESRVQRTRETAVPPQPRKTQTGKGKAEKRGTIPPQTPPPPPSP